MKEHTIMNIILHCSDSLFGNAAIISKWHVLPKPKGRGWSNIGYHYIVLNGQLSSNVFNKNYDGYIETGRPLDDDNLLESFEYGAHVKGMNTKSIGICLVGESGKFTDKQIRSMEYLLIGLGQQFGELEISQHSDWDDNKPHCAGFTQDYIDELNKIYK